MALRALVKAGASTGPDKASVVQLYRSISRELPRVMTIYDVDLPLKEAKETIQYHFRKNGSLQDGRVIGVLIAKGYMELEETLMQWKQKTHLLRILQPIELERAKPQNEVLIARDSLTTRYEELEGVLKLA